MRVLGIDPGSHRTGWGVVQAEGGRMRALASGVIRAGDGATAERLRTIADGVDEVLRQHRPDAVAIETVFHAKNAQSALILGQARGVALLCAARAEAEIFEYTAGQIKQAVSGRGRAEKEQVRQMVQLILGLDGPMAIDTSDALAAAICHAQTRVTTQATFLSTIEASRRPRSRRRSSARLPGGTP